MSAHNIAFYLAVIPEPSGYASERSAMSDRSAGHSYDPVRYEIRLKGHLGSRWAARFDGMTLTTRPDGTTLIEGPVDQAALHGLLRALRDLGLPLISVTQVEPRQPSIQEGDPYGGACPNHPDHRNERSPDGLE
jgi:hypothetical protein